MGTLASGSIDLKSLKVAGEGATSYITKIDEGGIKVHDINDNSNYINITSNNISIYNNSISTAEFGQDIRIGSYVNGQPQILMTTSNGLSDFIIQHQLSASTWLPILKFSCKTTSISPFVAPFFTLGNRGVDSDYPTPGDYSTVIGSGNIASGTDSFAEGNSTLAAGSEAHAEGKNTKALGSSSHSQNNGTIARWDSQTAIGTFNKQDSYPSSAIHPNGNRLYGNYAFIIGNGTADNARSNALTVDWNGNVTASGEYTTKKTTLSLGKYTTVGIITSSAKTLRFSIPTGRIFPSNYIIDSISFDILARVAYNDSTGKAGKYLICGLTSDFGTNPHYDTAPFDSSTSSQFYNANQQTKTITNTMWTNALYGQTNIEVYIDSNTSDFFNGGLGGTNNQPVVIFLDNIEVTFTEQ